MMKRCISNKYPHHRLQTRELLHWVFGHLAQRCHQAGRGATPDQTRGHPGWRPRAVRNAPGGPPLPAAEAEVLLAAADLQRAQPVPLQAGGELRDGAEGRAGGRAPGRGEAAQAGPRQALGWGWGGEWRMGWKRGGRQEANAWARGPGRAGAGVPCGPQSAGGACPQTSLGKGLARHNLPGEGIGQTPSQGYLDQALAQRPPGSTGKGFLRGVFLG